MYHKYVHPHYVMLDDQIPFGTGTVLNSSKAEKWFQAKLFSQQSSGPLSFRQRLILIKMFSVVLWGLMFLWQNIKHCCLGICIGHCFRFTINTSSNIWTKYITCNEANFRKNSENANYLIRSIFFMTIKQSFHYHMLPIFLKHF